jgi:hypothetical protein
MKMAPSKADWPHTLADAIAAEIIPWDRRCLGLLYSQHEVPGDKSLRNISLRRRRVPGAGRDAAHFAAPFACSAQHGLCDNDFLDSIGVVTTFPDRGQATTLVRAQRGKLVATPLGKSMLSDTRQGSLLAILFHIAFWRMDLEYFRRGLLGSWPQADIGIVLWSLSVSAGDWQTSDKLTRLCTIPEPAMLTGTWDRSAYAMEARILRPLLWFGLLEYRSEQIPESSFGARHYYRKVALFDRLLAFDVKMDLAEGPRH